MRALANVHRWPSVPVASMLADDRHENDPVLLAVCRRSLALAQIGPGKRQHQQTHDEQAQRQQQPVAKFARRELLILLLEKPKRAELDLLFLRFNNRCTRMGIPAPPFLQTSACW